MGNHGLEGPTDLSYHQHDACNGDGGLIMLPKHDSSLCALLVHVEVVLAHLVIAATHAKPASPQQLYEIRHVFQASRAYQSHNSIARYALVVMHIGFIGCGLQVI